MNYTKTEWKDLPDTTTPINASALNNIEDGIEYLFEHGLGVEINDNYSNSTTDSYSCNYVNNINTYSTNEIRIGTWIDGKTIYRKVFTGDIASSIEHGLTNVSFVNSYGYKMTDSGTFVPLPSVRPTNAGYYIGYYVTNQYIIFDKAADVNGVATIILEYTKTTDV